MAQHRSWASTLAWQLLVLASSQLVLAKELSLKDVKVDVLGADGSTVLSSSGAYPKELLKSPQIPAQQSIQVAATVLGDDGEATKAQQVFLALKHVGTGVSAYMVGKAKKEGSYLITVTPAAIEKQIGKQAGAYEVTLLMGDAQASQGINWKLGKVELLLPSSDPAPSVRTAHSPAISNTKPVITHMFRQPEKRPPVMISLVFTALVILVLVALLAFLVFGFGANFNGWPKDSTTALAALGFHGLIAAMLGLYLLFWTRWNLVQTLPVCLLLGAALVFVGHKALSGIASERLAAKAGKVVSKMD